MMTAPPKPSADADRPAEAVDIPPEWRAEFEAAARRTPEERFRYGFVKTYKPVLDDAEYRSWGHDRRIPTVVPRPPAGLAGVRVTLTNPDRE